MNRIEKIRSKFLDIIMRREIMKWIEKGLMRMKKEYLGRGKIEVIDKERKMKNIVGSVEKWVVDGGNEKEGEDSGKKKIMGGIKDSLLREKNDWGKNIKKMVEMGGVKRKNEKMLGKGEGERVDERKIRKGDDKGLDVESMEWGIGKEKSKRKIMERKWMLGKIIRSDWLNDEEKGKGKRKYGRVVKRIWLILIVECVEREDLGLRIGWEVVVIDLIGKMKGEVKRKIRIIGEEDCGRIVGC